MRNPMHDPRIILPEQKTYTPPFVYYNNVFSPPECDAIIQLAESKGMSYGTIGNGHNNEAREDLDYRTAKTCAINWWDRTEHGAQMQWMYDHIRDRVEVTNRDFFRFDLHGLWEDLAVMKYEEPIAGTPPGHYHWHQDYGGGMSSLRKLSVVVQLSDPGDYEGCRLEMFADRQFDPGHVQRGDMLIFPSFIPHRVTPIVRGTRYSLVGWVSGPQFR